MSNINYFLKQTRNKQHDIKSVDVKLEQLDDQDVNKKNFIKEMQDKVTIPGLIADWYDLIVNINGTKKLSIPVLVEPNINKSSIPQYILESAMIACDYMIGYDFNGPNARNYMHDVKKSMEPDVLLAALVKYHQI